MFLARVLSRFDREDVWRALLSGELETGVYCKGRTDFDPIRLSPALFANRVELKDRISDEHTIDIVETDPRRPARIRRRIPVPHWIYVTRASLYRFEKALRPKAAHPPGTLKGEDIAKFVKDYLDTEPKPTLTGERGIRNKWSAAGHGAQARELLDDEYRKQAEARNISLKRGPKS